MTTALEAVALIQRHHDYADEDVFRNNEGGYLLSKPMSTLAWFVSPEGKVRCGRLSHWKDFEVRAVIE